MKNWKQKAIMFLVSQAVTLFGSTLVQMAIIWYVTLNTGEGVWISTFTIASYLPQFLISFIGGVWADRYSKKVLIIGADACIAIITLAMWFCIPYLSSASLMLSLLLIMSVIRSACAGIQTPAVNATLPHLVPQESLMRYNGINTTMQSIANFAAPAAAGVVLSFSTLGSALLIDVATAIVGISIFACVAVPKGESKESSSVLADMKSGAFYAVSNKILKTLLITYGFFIFFSVPSGFLAQLFVSRTFGETYWYLTAVEVVGFLGMITGGIIMSTWGGFKNRTLTLTFGLAVFGILGGSYGSVGIFFVVSCFDVPLWHSYDDDTNRSYHYDPGKCRGKYARTSVWTSWNNVLRIFAHWNGFVRSCIRCDTFTMDYGSIGRYFDFNVSYVLL